MPNIEWQVLHHLLTPGGNIDFNTATGYRFISQASDYKILPSLRVTSDPISQADGSVLHPRWKTGLAAQLRIAYWVHVDVNTSAQSADSADEPACGDNLRFMHERLVSALNSIRQNSGAVQRLQWQPTGYGDLRMLDQIQLLAWPDPAYDLDGGEASVGFSVESPFPYAIDATQTTTLVGGSSGTASCNNVGTAAFSPVVKVNGPVLSGFTLTNLSDLDELGAARKIVYDATRPGSLAIPGGQYAELDFFRGTIFLNGSGANLAAGLDPTLSDFWHLLTNAELGGPNRITLTGAPSGSILWNNAWA